MTFLYDYGDEWRFRVDLIATGEAKSGVDYPEIVGRAGTAPVQYPDHDEEDEGDEDD